MSWICLASSIRGHIKKDLCIRSLRVGGTWRKAMLLSSWRGVLASRSQHSEKKDHLQPLGAGLTSRYGLPKAGSEGSFKDVPHNCQMTPHPVLQPQRLCFAVLAQSVSSELAVGGMAFVTLHSPTILSLWLLVAISA